MVICVGQCGVGVRIPRSAPLVGFGAAGDCGVGEVDEPVAGTSVGGIVPDELIGVRVGTTGVIGASVETPANVGIGVPKPVWKPGHAFSLA